MLLGIYRIVNGAVETFAALSHRGMQNRGWTIFMGLLSLVAGVVVLVYPGISLATLALVLGFRLRAVGHAASRAAAAT